MGERVLGDVGALLGEALKGPVAWLNPARIVLTGALALAPVRDAVDRTLLDAHPITTHPRIEILGADEDGFARVRGAGLAVIREHVHRRLPGLLGGPRKTLSNRVQNLTLPLAATPWE